MNNIFNPVYRQDYLLGYARGFNPYIKFEENPRNWSFAHVIFLRFRDLRQIYARISSADCAF